MVILLMSGVILLSVLLGGVGVSYWLWRRGFWGRCVLVAGLACVAMEAHAKIYPQPHLKQHYERIILGMDSGR